MRSCGSAPSSATCSIPTRVAVFPPGSTLTRIDATGLSANDLNESRSDLASSRHASSSVLVDDGPRRWLIGVAWNDTDIRRLEELTERAGFVDVAIDPSPLALVRALDPTITHLQRDAAADQSIAAIVSGGAVVAAAAIDSVGRLAPALSCSDVAVSVGWFDGLDEPADVVVEIRRLLDDAPPVDCPLWLAGHLYPGFPPHDVRAPERQCVAIGAAIGAAGLAGRLRPVDMLMPIATTSSELERPWAIERLSDLPTTSIAGHDRADETTARSDASSAALTATPTPRRLSRRRRSTGASRTPQPPGGAAPGRRRCGFLQQRRSRGERSRVPARPPLATGRSRSRGA